MVSNSHDDEVVIFNAALKREYQIKEFAGKRTDKST